jgi:hypothetical protein
LAAILIPLAIKVLLEAIFILLFSPLHDRNRLESVW